MDDKTRVLLGSKPEDALLAAANASGADPSLAASEHPTPAIRDLATKMAGIDLAAKRPTPAIRDLAAAVAALTRVKTPRSPTFESYGQAAQRAAANRKPVPMSPDVMRNLAELMAAMNQPVVVDAMAKLDSIDTRPSQRPLKRVSGRAEAAPTARRIGEASPTASVTLVREQRRAFAAMVQLPGSVEAMKALLAAMYAVLERMAEHDDRAEARAVVAEAREAAQEARAIEATRRQKEAEARERARAERGEKRERIMVRMTAVALLLAVPAAGPTLSGWAITAGRTLLGLL